MAQVLARMENIGFLVDGESIRVYGERLETEIEALQKQIYEEVGYEFNINSPKQLGDALFVKLGLPSGKKTKTGYSTNAEILEKLRYDHPAVELGLHYRTLTKLKSTYCEGMLKVIGPDGRIHSNFNQTETRTGRISSTEPNLQNIPVRTELGRELRKFFLAKEGWVLVDADYSQIELRVLAHIAHDENMIKAFQDKEDIHTITASQVFGMPPEMVTPLMRSRAKAVNFGIVYGIGAFSLSKDINVSRKEAQRYIDDYLTLYSGVDRYMKEVVEKAKELQGMYRKRTILFIDEIHRFNKGQQDYLLPYVEDGTIILIGATTENPYFEVNGALISRSVIFELKPIPREAIKELLKKAVYDTDRGMGAYNGTIDEDALDFLADISGGDARHALNAIELGIMTTEPGPDGKIHITLDVAQQCIQKRAARYDKNGDNHYDTISAFIKSMRGSDPDAAVYYLARMLNAGESVTFIARRIMICASEDVGNADPQALQVAVAASQAVERLGMPEARITLAQAAAYVACAPKSNAAIMAIDEAMALVRSTQAAPVPPYLQDAHYGAAEKLGHGVGYKYAHDYPGYYVKQQYLPDEIKAWTWHWL